MRVAAVLILFAFVAPVRSAEAGTVRIWHALRGDEQRAVETLLLAASERHPGLTVEPLALPYDAFRQRLTNAIPHGNGPDLFIAPHESIGEWARAGLLQVVPPQVPWQGVSAPAMEAVTFEGKRWAVPLSGKSIAMLYDARNGQAPATVEALLAQRAPEGGRAFAYEAGNFYHHAALLHAFSGRVFGPDGVPRLDTEPFVQSLAFVRDLVVQGHLPAEVDSAWVTTLWNDGRVGVVWNGPWFLGEAAASRPPAAAPLPTLDATGKALQPFLTVESLFLAARSRADNEDLTRVIDALASVDGALLRLREGRQIPVLDDPRLDEALSADPVLRAFADQSRAAVPMPNDPAMAAVWEPANRALRAVLRGEVEPRAAARRAQRELDRALRPPPQPAAPGPYLAILGVLSLVGAGFLGRRLADPSVRASFRSTKVAWLWVGPALLSLALLMALPFVVGASVAFFAHHDGQFTFVGLRNFLDILLARDQGFWEPMSFWYTLAVTVLWTLANVVLHTGIGLGLALLLRAPWLRLRTLYRVLLIIPWAVPNYITALVWRGLFHHELGAINHVLTALGQEPVSWFARFSTAFAANLCTNTWLGFPFMMVTTLGALQSIPKEVEEAAALDGANAWQRFRHITLPLLRPALLPSVLLGSVWTFNMFNIIYLVSSGEPGGSTEILITEAYRWAFTRQAQYGYASAYALLIFGILLLWGRLSRRIEARA